MTVSLNGLRNLCARSRLRKHSLPLCSLSFLSSLYWRENGDEMDEDENERNA
jgi:hypothetical protein